jgi:hypothetical protein
LVALIFVTHESYYSRLNLKGGGPNAVEELLEADEELASRGRILEPPEHRNPIELKKGLSLLVFE